MFRRSFIVCAAGWSVIAKASSSIQVPFQLIDGSVVVDVRLNGTGPYEFIVDTGATSGLLSSTLAQRLGLPEIGESLPSPRGDQFEVLRVHKLDLAGGLVLRNLVYEAIPVGTDSVLGTVGCGLLTRQHTRMDFDRGLIEFPTAPSPGDTGYTPLKTEFMREQPPYETRFGTDVTVDDMTLPALWDTGNGATLQISDAVGTQLGLWSETVPYAPKRVGHVGGPDKKLSRVVRAKRVQVGPYVYDRPLVLLRWQAVNRAVLGLSLMQTMNFEVDPAGSIAVKRSTLPVGPVDYPKSGLWIEHSNQDIVVADVGFGSPAAAGGIQAGDIVIDPPDLDDARDMLSGPAGKTIQLKLRRNGALISPTITLADYL
jgi:serine protease Do